ncbi:MAG: hypothetical protein HYV28_14780 [Ignavibacteriales bacterium]|nr:hypothetical protein [Ignavibacteriales bacterium]
MNIKFYFVIIISMISVTLCQKKESVTPIVKSPPMYLYEVEYYHGFKETFARYNIDTNGTVHKYVMHIYGPDNAVRYTAQKLLAKFILHDTLRKIISRDTLLWSYQLAAKTLLSPKVDSLHNVIHDAPDCYYFLYRYLPETNEYQRFTLLKDGSNAYFYNSESAKLLVAWFDRVFFLDGTLHYGIYK